MKSACSLIRLLRFAGLVGIAFPLFTPGSLIAVDVYWDADGVVNSTYGGTGTWDASSALWGSASNGTGTDNAWTATDSAIFIRSTTGTVTVDAAGVSATAVKFTGSGSGTAYTFNGGRISLTAADYTTGLQLAEGTATFDNILDFATSLRVNTGSYTTLNLSGGMNFTGSSSKALQFYGTTNATINIGALTRSGPSTFNIELGSSSGANSASYMLNASNTGVANTTLRKGVVVINHASALGSGTVSIDGAQATAETQSLLIGTAGITVTKAINFTSSANNAGDTRVLGSNITTGTATFSGDINMKSGDGSTQVTAAAGGTTVFSGLIDDASESIGISKTGAGIVKFTRAAGNTYDGDTTVSAGAFIVNNTSGSGTGTGAVTVNNGATFGGTGASSGEIVLQAGGRLSPGDMDEAGASYAGTFTGTSLAWNSNNIAAGLFFNLGADQVSSDQLALSGSFSKGSGTAFIFDFTGSTIDPSLTYTLVIFGSTDFMIGDFAAINGGDGQFAFIGNSLVFGAAIPEPSACASLFGALALTGAVWFRRRTASSS